MGTRWRLDLEDDGTFPVFQNSDTGILRIARKDSMVFILPTGSKVQLYSEPELLVKNELGEVKIYTNVGSTLGEWLTEWSSPRPGPYWFCMRYKNDDDMIVSTKWSIIVVEPQLKVAGREISDKSICLQTVLTRSCGFVEDWPKLLSSSASLNYNMIHFTPVQPLGQSGSSYSLYDHCSIDKSF